MGARPVESLVARPREGGLTACADATAVATRRYGLTSAGSGNDLVAYSAAGTGATQGKDVRGRLRWGRSTEPAEVRTRRG